jgi:hypothetical protein
MPVLSTVSDLLDAVRHLPAPDRAAARARIDAALEGDARTCRAALGMLALDLAAPAALDQGPAAAAPRRDLELRVHVIDLERDRVPARATA